MKDKLILMEDVVGSLAAEYGVPTLKFDDLVTLGKRAAIVFHLDEKATYISFEMLCHYIKLYISTPFGLKELRRLQCC